MNTKQEQKSKPIPKEVFDRIRREQQERQEREAERRKAREERKL